MATITVTPTADEQARAPDPARAAIARYVDRELSEVGESAYLLGDDLFGAVREELIGADIYASTISRWDAGEIDEAERDREYDRVDKAWLASLAADERWRVLFDRFVYDHAVPQAAASAASMMRRVLEASIATYIEEHPGGSKSAELDTEYSKLLGRTLEPAPAERGNVIDLFGWLEQAARDRRLR